jgi:NAD kinase
MNSDFQNFLENLSEEQIANLQGLFQKNQKETNDKTTKKTEKEKEGYKKNPEEEEEINQETEDNEQAEKAEENNFDAHVVVNDDFTVTRNTKETNRKTPVKFKKNKWVDDGEYSEIETPNFKKTPRNRSKPKKEKVECHVCGKVFFINSSLIYGEYHRCNKCTGR